MINESAYVLLSGGQDSTTTLFWAIENFNHVEAVSIFYGQRHKIELQAARDITKLANVNHVEFNFPTLISIGDSSLVSERLDVDGAHAGSASLPSSFTPGRNDLLLTIAAAFAYKRRRENLRGGSINLVTGVCQTDYSGYPDCRQSFIDAKAKCLSLALDIPVFIYTPLMHLTKKETVLLAQKLGSLCWTALGLSVTCYRGVLGGCDECPACKLRNKGFDEVGVVDPAKRMLGA